jgi:hypothetical protein
MPLVPPSGPVVVWGVWKVVVGGVAGPDTLLGPEGTGCWPLSVWSLWPVCGGRVVSSGLDGAVPGPLNGVSGVVGPVVL